MSEETRRPTALTTGQFWASILGGVLVALFMTRVVFGFEGHRFFDDSFVWWQALIHYGILFGSIFGLQWYMRRTKAEAGRNT